MKNHLLNKYIRAIVVLLALLPLFASAQGYTPLVGIPGVSAGNFDQYINSIYALSISLAALLAVIKIIIAGVKWMMTDVVTSKSEAKADIRGALLGLLVILSAVLILTLINDDITNVQLTGTGGTVSTQNPNTPASAPAGPSYTVNSGNGYTWIAYDESYTNRLDFEQNCDAADNELLYLANYTPRQIRCVAPTATQDSSIRTYVPSMSTSQQDAFVQQYAEYVLPNELSSSELATAHSAWESDVSVSGTTVLFGINMNTATIEEENQFRSLVQQVAQSENDADADIDIIWQEITVSGTSYLIAIDAGSVN